MVKKGATHINNPPDELSEKKKEKRKRLKKEKKAQKQKEKKNRTVLQDGQISSSTQDDESSAHTCPELAAPGYTNIDKSIKSAYNQLWENHFPLTTTIIREADWHTERPQEQHTAKVVVDVAVRNKLKDLAALIYKNELAQYQKFEEGAGGRDARFRRQILTHGAAKDKLAAHILRITESPLHSLEDFSRLVTIISSNKDSQIKEITKTLEQVVSSSLLPKGLVARRFDEHDFHSLLLPLITSNKRNAEKVLLVWYFEDQLKIHYKKLVDTLQQVSKTGAENTKQKSVQLLLHLLGNHPQQEAEQILQVLVNKLGDLDKSVAIAVVYGIRKLLIRRPVLKGRVVDICAEFLYRPNQRGNTQYNCMLLLKDVLYTKDDATLVQKMVKLYFGFFKACTKKGEVDSKLMSVILRGLNRALPFLQGQKGGNSGGEGGSMVFLEEQLNMLYKMCHLVSFNITVQILQLLYHVHVAVEGPLTERYHRVLYSQLLRPELSRSSSASAFLNLVFKSMNRMTNTDTLKAFAKRMLQMSQFMPVHLSIGIIFLLAEVCNDNPVMAALVNTAAASDVKKEGQVKEDDEEAEQKSVVRDLESVIEPIAQRRKNIDEDEEDSDDEYFEDLDVEADGKHVLAQKKTTAGKCNGMVTNVDVNAISSTMNRHSAESKNREKKGSWLHRDNSASVMVKQEMRKTRYDPYDRNPTYCGVQFTAMWELSHTIRHFHPSVKTFAEKMLAREKLGYTGDPLIDFSFIKFLDRFIYKNPKKVSDALKDSAGSRALGAKSQYSGSALRIVNVATENFKKLSEAHVPEDAKFFHKYFTIYKNKQRGSKKRGKGVDGYERDNVDIDDDEFDEYLETMGGKDGELQLPYRGDDEHDEQWDFAAKAKKSSDKDTADSDEDDLSDDDSEESGERDDEAMDEYPGGEDEDEGDYPSGEDDDSPSEEDEDDYPSGEDSDMSALEIEGGDVGDMYLDDFEQSEEKSHKCKKPQEEDSKTKKKKEEGSRADKNITKKESDSKKKITKKESDSKKKITKKESQSNKEGVQKDDKAKKKSGKKDKLANKKRRREEEEEMLDGEDDDGWASLSGGDSEDDEDEYHGLDNAAGDDDIDFDEENVDFSDEDDLFSKKTNKRRKMDDFLKLPKGGRSRAVRSLDSMMMDADEFSRLLQQNETRAPAITGDDFVNTGKTSLKQLKWERSKAGEARPAGGKSFNKKGGSGKQKFKRK